MGGKKSGRETKKAARILIEIFDRAARLAPSVIIMDEINAIAGSRDSGESPHLWDVASQLLVLMNGLTERDRILVIATTNLPNNIDPAILRLGRIDRQIYMGPLDKNVRTNDILRSCLNLTNHYIKYPVIDLTLLTILV